MAKARYEISVPNHARQVAIATHQYLTNGQVPGLQTATVQYGHPNDLIVIVGDETPELDSHMKQTGTFLGEVANLPSVAVTKQGKNVAHWTMHNPNYLPGPAGVTPFTPPPEAPLGHPGVAQSLTSMA